MKTKTKQIKWGKAKDPNLTSWTEKINHKIIGKFIEWVYNNTNNKLKSEIEAFYHKNNQWYQVKINIEMNEV